MPIVPPQESLFDGKVCTKCGTWRLFAEFGPHKGTRDGKRSQCRKCDSAASARYNKSVTKEQKQVWNKTQYERHREKLVAKSKAVYAADPERAKARITEWKRRNPEHARALRHAHKAKIRNTNGTYKAAHWKAMCAWFGNRCLACHVVAPLVVDHVIPLSRGGTNTIDNLQPLCATCNHRKYANTVDYREPAELARFLLSLPR